MPKSGQKAPTRKYKKGSLKVGKPGAIATTAKPGVQGKKKGTKVKITDGAKRGSFGDPKFGRKKTK